MNSNKNTSSLPAPFNRLAGTSRPFKPPVVQLKTGVFAQSIKHPIAPPVYRPQQTPEVLQTKRSTIQNSPGNQEPRRPVAPAVYRPEAKRRAQPTVNTQSKLPAQMKSAGLHASRINRAVVQRFAGTFKKGEGLWKDPWHLDRERRTLVSNQDYPHITIYLSHTSHYKGLTEEHIGLSFNQFHYSKTAADSDRVTFNETSPGKWQPQTTGPNYAEARKAAEGLLSILGPGHTLDNPPPIWGTPHSGSSFDSLLRKNRRQQDEKK